MTPTALVFAGGSFLGRHLCRALAVRGVRVAATARLPASGTDLRPCDVTDPDSTAAAVADRRPDWVFQCAGVTEPGAAPPALYAVHVGGAWNVLRAVADHAPDATVVFFGSAAEYGPAPAKALPVGEGYPACPASFFGASKLAQTHLAAAAAAALGLRVLVLRPFNVLGPGLPGHYLAASLARRVCEAGTAAGPLAVDNGAATRDFVDVRDVAEATVLAAAHAAPPPGTAEVYNVASGRETAVLAVAARLCTLAGRGLPEDRGPGGSRSGIGRSCGSAAKLRRATGWAPRVPWEQSLEELWRGYAAPQGTA
jgi:nucleoside-diphosphate-sugar epimerase